MTPGYIDFISKLSIAVLGAGIALILNRFVKIIDERSKQKDIRKLIVSDLDRQLNSLRILKGDILTIIPLFNVFENNPLKKGPHDYLIHLNSGFQTDTFKSQTRLDFFKSFKEDDFQLLMFIYNSIKIFESIDLEKTKTNLISEYVKYDREHTDGKSEFLFRKFCQNEVSLMEGYLLGIDDTICKIYELNLNTESNYFSSMDKIKKIFKKRSI